MIFSNFISLDLKREKIRELLSYIEDRLKELEGEKDELKAFHELDRDRRALEYSIFTNEVHEAQNALDEVCCLLLSNN